jgi:hypothetical protein
VGSQFDHRRRLILRLGYRPVVLAGMVTAAARRVAAGVCVQRDDVDAIDLGSDSVGSRRRLTLASLMIGAQHAVPRLQLGVVTSAVQFSRSIGAALGIGVMGAVMSWSLRLQLARGGSELGALASPSGDVARAGAAIYTRLLIASGNALLATGARALFAEIVYCWISNVEPWLR